MHKKVRRPGVEKIQSGRNTRKALKIRHFTKNEKLEVDGLFGGKSLIMGEKQGSMLGEARKNGSMYLTYKGLTHFFNSL